MSHFQRATRTGDEPTGTIRQTANGLQAVPQSSKGAQIGDAAIATLTFTDGDQAGIHGHLDNSMEDVPTANGGYGDTSSLPLGKPMFTVEGSRLGVHDAPNGQLRFQMIRGKLGRSEQRAIQRNLDREQQLFNDRYKPPQPKDPCHTGAVSNSAVDTCSG
jgi:hypothetical protein